MQITFHHPHASQLVRFIPEFLSEFDPRPAREQFNERYAHGGGWHPFRGFALQEDNSLQYPDDPAYPVRASIQLRDELILIYDHDWVAIVQPDRSFEVCRMD